MVKGELSKVIEVKINNDEGVVVVRKKTRIFPQPRVYVRGPK